MPYKEKEIERMFYAIGEVAEMFKVNVSQIRFYANEFEVLSPAKTKKGNRLFTPEDLAYLKVIFYLLKDRGYTLEGAKKKLKEDRKVVETDFELRESLMRLRGFLVELKEQL